MTIKRTLVMLAKPYDPLKFKVEGSYMSEKLDGVRALWIPFTRGLPIDKVPWANRARDDRDYICTGLWTRRGKPIIAPDWFLNGLDQDMPLDGELFAGRGMFQKTTSTIRKLTPNDDEWAGISYQVFDVPNYSSFLEPGQIREGGSAGDPAYEVYVSYTWISQFWPFLRTDPHYTQRRFNETLAVLSSARVNEKFVKVLNQELLPPTRGAADAVMNERLAQVTEQGGEGLMLRRGHSIWTPNRSQDLVKVKKLHDAEAVICGYTFGVGKYQGMVGAFRVTWTTESGKEVTFDLSGFTDAERAVKFQYQSLASSKPGEFVQTGVSELFPLGSTVTFAYNDLTNDGVPRFARFLRRVDQV